MDYIVRNSQLMSLQESYAARSEDLAQSFEKLDKAVDGLINCDGFQGNAATNMREYMSCTYGRLTGVMGQVSAIIAQQFTGYVGKYTKLDSDYAAYISTKTLTDIRGKLKNRKDQLDAANSAFLKQESGTLHTGDVRFCYDKAPEAEALTKIETLDKDLESWTQTIVDIEENDIENEFKKIDSLLSALEGLVKYQSKLDPNKPFDRVGYQRELVKVGVAYSEVITELQAKKADLKASAERLQEMKTQKAKDEYEARKKETAWIGWVVDAVCAVTTVVATATLGPVGTIVTGAITGFVKSAVHEALDQYVETGASIGDMQWDRILIKGAVGGATGALTSAIGVGMGNVSSAIGEMGGAFGKGMAKIGLSIVKNEADTLVDHAGRGAEEFLIATIVDKKSVSEAWEKAETAFVQDLGKDMLISAETGLTSQIGSIVTGNMDAGFGKSLLTAGIDGGVEMADYAFETLVDENKSFDAKEMLAKGVKKATSSVVKEGFSDLTSDHFPIKQWEEKQSKGKAVVIDTLIGGVSSGMGEACGGFVSDRFVRGQTTKQAFDGNFTLTDKNGYPSSALKKAAEGATDSLGKSLHDRVTGPGVTDEKELSDKEFREQYGRDREEGERATRTTEHYAQGKKTVTYTLEKTEGPTVDDRKVFPKDEQHLEKTVTKTVDVYERGERIGGGSTKETTDKGFYSRKQETTTEGEVDYVRRDGTRVHSETHSTAGNDGSVTTKTIETEIDRKGAYKATVTDKTVGYDAHGEQETHTETRTRETDSKGRIIAESGSTSDTKATSTRVDGDKYTKETEKSWSYDRKAREANETTKVTYKSDNPKADKYEYKSSRDFDLRRNGETRKVTDTESNSRTTYGKVTETTSTNTTRTETERKWSDGKDGSPRFKDTSEPKTDTETKYKTGGAKIDDTGGKAARKNALKAGEKYEDLAKRNQESRDAELNEADKAARKKIADRYRDGIGIPSAKDLGLFSLN